MVCGIMEEGLDATREARGLLLVSTIVQRCPRWHFQRRGQ
jgi:hypothetical protein